MSSSEHRKPAPPSFAALVQSFFAEHLTQQRALSPQTVAAYRDAFVLFLERVFVGGVCPGAAEGERARFDLVPANGHGWQAVSEGARWLHGGMARRGGKLWGYYQNSSC